MPKSTIYHGSQFIIKTPVYGEGNPHNDYGLGFYCTHDIELAKEWACTDENGGYANQYELDLTSEGKEYLLERFLPDTRAYDVIVGYRANDSYFSFANAFLNNTLSLAQLECAMHLGKLGEQTVLKSRKSFDHIYFVSTEPANREMYYPMRSTRDREARLAYRKEQGQQRAADSVYLVDILRGGWDNNEAFIRRDVSL